MKIFISHSSKDKEIVELFINLLTSALRIDPHDIFCTSYANSISIGDDWRNSIKKNLAEAEIVLLFISDNYKKSEICLNEMGAIYFCSEIQQIPLIIPPIRDNAVGILYEINQHENLLDLVGLERLKDKLSDKSTPKIKSDYWESNKKKFIDDATLLCKLQEEPRGSITGDRLPEKKYSPIVIVLILVLACCGSYYVGLYNTAFPKKDFKRTEIKNTENSHTETKTKEVENNKSEIPKSDFIKENKKTNQIKTKSVLTKEKLQNNTTVKKENYENYKKSLDEKLRNRYDEKK